MEDSENHTPKLWTCINGLINPIKKYIRGRSFNTEMTKHHQIMNDNPFKKTIHKSCSHVPRIHQSFP